MNSKITALYSDGGCVKKNPSPYGLTWAWCAVNDSNNRVEERSGYILKAGVTNNHAEATAGILALEWAQLQGLHDITLFTDSNVTRGRLAEGWAYRHTPKNIMNRGR